MRRCFSWSWRSERRPQAPGRTWVLLHLDLVAVLERERAWSVCSMPLASLWDGVQGYRASPWPVALGLFWPAHPPRTAAAASILSALAPEKMDEPSAHTHTHQGQQPYSTEALGRELGPCDGESPWKHASGHVYKSLSHRARKVHPECGGTNSGAVPSNRRGEQLTQALSSKPRRTSGWIKALLAKVLE